MTTEKRIHQNVVWTRGNGCLELAEILAEGSVERIQGDLSAGCISHRADFVISKKMPGNFDTAHVAVPVDFEPEHVSRVSATVAGGPHSELAAETADRIAKVLGVPLEVVSAHQDADDIGKAIGVVAEYGDRYPAADRRVVQAQDMNELSEAIDDGSLLVVGAPGGEWLRRSRFGRGARLKGATKGGAVMVRSAPDRVYRFMGEPVYVAPLLQASDTIRLHPQNVLAVADQGMLVGVVRREALGKVGDDAVASVMEDPVSTRVDETLEEASVLTETFGSDPIPVTDHEEHLVGGLSLPAA